MEKGFKLKQAQLKRDQGCPDSDAEMKVESDENDSEEDNQLEVKIDDKEDSEPIQGEGAFDKMLFTLNYPALELFPSQRAKTPSFCYRSVSVTNLVRQHLSESRTYDGKQLDDFVSTLNKLHNHDENRYRKED